MKYGKKTLSGMCDKFAVRTMLTSSENKQKEVEIIFIADTIKQCEEYCISHKLENEDDNYIISSIRSLVKYYLK